MRRPTSEYKTEQIGINGWYMRISLANTVLSTVYTMKIKDGVLTTNNKFRRIIIILFLEASRVRPNTLLDLYTIDPRLSR